jgi:hypothetical protein
MGEVILNKNQTEELISHLNKFLGSDFKLIIGNIPVEHIKNGNTKFVALIKIPESDDNFYTDWYYDEFINKIKNSAERMQIVDRDMDSRLAGEFSFLGKQIIVGLNKFKNE